MSGRTDQFISRILAVEHTPTPWAVRSDEALKIDDSQGNMIAMISQTHLRGRREPGEASASAAFIVKAVNGHEPMDKLLAEAADFLNASPTMEGMNLGNKITQFRLAMQKGVNGAVVGAVPHD